MDPLTFVRSLQLDEQSSYPSTAKARATFSDAKEEGLVDAGSLVSFTSTLKGQQKSDVLNSTLFAQLAATKKHDRYKDTENWYKEFANVLNIVGWVLQGFKFDQYRSSEDSFNISQITLELLSTLIGEDATLLKTVQATLKGLAKDSEGLTLFSSKSSSENHGNFQILPCEVDKNGQINVAFIGAHFKASQVSQDYLFVSYSTQDISLFKTAQIFTLDEDIYSQVRDEIIAKLGKNAKENIHNIPI